MRLDLTSTISDVFIELALLLAPLSDLLLKSAFIILIVALASFLLHRYLNSSTRHLLWLNALVCVLLLPMLTVISFQPVANQSRAPSYDVVTVSLIPREVSQHTEASISDASQLFGPVDLPAILLLSYAMVAMGLLVRLLFDAFKIRRINQKAEPATRLVLVKKINQIKRQLNVCRPVAVKFSDAVSSPISFGLFRPVVIFPSIAEWWPEHTFDSALVHELAHISRLDWLSHTLGYLCCAVYWINPFSWFALSRLAVEAESACDMTAMRWSNSNSAYASDLLSIAKSCKEANDHKLLVQYMLSAKYLKKRISLLLAYPKGEAKSSIATPQLFAMSCAAIVILLCTGSFLRVAVVDQSGMPGSELIEQWRRALAGTASAGSLQVFFEDEIALNISLPEYPLMALNEPDVSAENASASRAVRRQSAVHEMQNRKYANSSNVASASIESSIELELPRVTPVPNLVAGQLASQGTSLQPQLDADLDNLSKTELEDWIAATELQYFDAFNSTQKDKSLHVICEDYLPLGSFIRKRACEPRFLIEARSEDMRAWGTMTSNTVVHNSFEGGPLRQEFLKLTEAMNDALRSDTTFRELHLRLQQLKSVLDEQA